MAIEYTKEQRQVIDLRNRDLLVAAAAGSGKTAVLVERICQLVLEEEHPMDIDELLVVTFTNAAAAEMKNRVLKALQGKLRENPENKHLQKQISLVHSAFITTIDGFCLQFLKEHFYLLDLEPGFRIVDENEKKLIMEDVMDRVLNQYYEKADERFLTFVENYTEGKTDERLSEFIRKMYVTASAYPWPEKWLQQCMDGYDEEKIASPEDIGVIKEALKDCERKAKDAIALLRYHEKQCREYPAILKMADYLKSELDRLEGLEQATSLEDYYKVLGEFKFATLPRASKLSEIEAEVRQEAKEGRDEAKSIINSLKESYFAVSPEKMLEEHFYMKPMIDILCEMTLTFMQEFGIEKRKRNVVDFSDMEHLTLQILYDDEESVSNVAKEYGSRFREIMVDEYQDSNELQEAILKALTLAKTETHMFMVGDVKQSIYRFRQAEPGLFIEKYKRFCYEDGKEQKIDLDQNFRSRQGVLRFSNFIFDGVMQEDLGQIAYDEQASLKYGAHFDRELDELFKTKISLIDMKNCELEKERAEAILIGQEIRNLVENGKVTGENGEYRDVTYSDIVILLRAKAMSKIIAEELSAMGIPVISMESTGYFRTQEVSTMLFMLQLIDNTRQDIALAAVLNSPIVSLSKKQLAVIRGNAKEESFYEAVKHFEGNEEIERKRDKFFALLDDLKWKASYLPIHELIKEIYKKTGYYEYATLMPQGEIRRMNLDILVERAKQYESTSYHGLFHFLRYIDKLKEYNIDLSEDNSQDGQNAVRMMTIHKSKGLEFPIVIAAGLGRNFNTQDTKEHLITNAKHGVVLRYTDTKRRTRKDTITQQAMKNILKNENLAEEIRVLYVAFTRAKERLILTGTVKDYEKIKGKLAVNINEEGRLSYSGKVSATNYLDWIIPMVSHNMARVRADFSLEIFDDISTQEMDVVEIEDKIRLLERMKKPTFTEAGQERLRYLFEKQYHHKDELDLKLKMSVSEIKHHFMELAFSHELEEYEEEPMIPAFVGEEQGENIGALKGTATHRILECLDFTAPWTENCTRKAVEQEIEELCSKGLISRQQAELVHPMGIVHLMQSELGKLLVTCARNKTLKKEQPFVMGITPGEAGINLASDDLVLVQGIIDVFMETEDGIILLDYKTDAVKDASELVKRYKKQMELYKEAIERGRNKKVVRMCMYSFRLKEIVDVI